MFNNGYDLEIQCSVAERSCKSAIGSIVHPTRKGASHGRCGARSKIRHYFLWDWHFVRQIYHNSLMSSIAWACLSHGNPSRPPQKTMQIVSKRSRRTGCICRSGSGMRSYLIIRERGDSSLESCLLAWYIRTDNNSSKNIGNTVREEYKKKVFHSCI